MQYARCVHRLKCQHSIFALVLTFQSVMTYLNIALTDVHNLYTVVLYIADCRVWQKVSPKFFSIFSAMAFIIKFYRFINAS